VQRSISAPEQLPLAGRGLRRVRKAFTLVEVMVATVLLSLIIVTILDTLIGSYRVAAKARYADHARYVIKSFADQFLTQTAWDQYGNVYPMWQSTVDPVSGNLTPQGSGLSWTNADGSSGYVSAPDPDGVSLAFYVLLGDTSGAPVTATVTRTVQWVTADYTGAPGNPTLIQKNLPAGYMLVATFSISYPFLGVTVPAQSITVVRALP